MNTWIRVTDRIPKSEGAYIAAIANKDLPNKVPSVLGAIFVDGVFMQDNRPVEDYMSGQYYVTHWCYLPSPPSDPY